MIHLDTGFLIRALVREAAEDVAMREWLRSGEDLGINTVGWAEFLCGPLSPEQVVLASRLRILAMSR